MASTKTNIFRQKPPLIRSNVAVFGPRVTARGLYFFNTNRRYGIRRCRKVVDERTSGPDDTSPARGWTSRSENNRTFNGRKVYLVFEGYWALANIRQVPVVIDLYHYVRQ
jgi:hypothetical protein